MNSFRICGSLASCGQLATGALACLGVALVQRGRR